MSDDAPFQFFFLDEELENYYKEERRTARLSLMFAILATFIACLGLYGLTLHNTQRRTREIGIRKAIGSKAETIKKQFLFEAILIGQIGGLFGIFLGILVGNLVSLLTRTSFIVPWIWIFGGVAACFFVGLASGYFPAVKASKLDPIIALHHE